MPRSNRRRFHGNNFHIKNKVMARERMGKIDGYVSIFRRHDPAWHLLASWQRESDHRSGFQRHFRRKMRARQDTDIFGEARTVGIGCGDLKMPFVTSMQSDQASFQPGREIAPAYRQGERLAFITAVHQRAVTQLQDELQRDETSFRYRKVSHAGENAVRACRVAAVLLRP